MLTIVLFISPLEKIIYYYYLGLINRKGNDIGY